MGSKVFSKLLSRLTAFIILLIMSIACEDRGLLAKLDQVERIINEQPGNALEIIKSIDTLSLLSNSLKARYSLLHAMALDKNYIDTTNIKVVMPAVDYYRKHGTADERMKSYYYLGRIQANAGDYSASAISFSICENEIKNTNDAQMEGLLYMAFADIYNTIRNIEKEEEYVRKGTASFEKAGDLKHSNLSIGRLAIVKYNKQEWLEADSLFRNGLAIAASDTIAMSVFLSNYARMKVVMPEQDPKGAIALLKIMVNNYNRPFSLSDFGVYAYASLLTGDEKTCQEIERYFESLSGQQITSISFWLSKIEQYKGNYKTALDYIIQSYANNTKSVNQILSHSVTQILQDYYEQAANEAEKESKILTMKILLLSCSLFIVLLALFLIYKRKREIKQAESERLLRISEESNRMLQITKNRLQDQVDSYSRQVDEIRIAGTELEKTLETLRKGFASTYKDKFSAIGELCHAYLETQNRTDKKDIIFRRVENLIAYISDDDKLHLRFENQINKDLNNIVKHLKNDLGYVNKQDSRFICYCIVGFDPEMIGTILGLSLSNVYTKKSRLKEKIRRLDSPYKDDYLRML